MKNEAATRTDAVKTSNGIATLGPRTGTVRVVLSNFVKGKKDTNKGYSLTVNIGDDSITTNNLMSIALLKTIAAAQHEALEKSESCALESTRNLVSSMITLARDNWSVTNTVTARWGSKKLRGFHDSVQELSRKANNPKMTTFVNELLKLKSGNLLTNLLKVKKISIIDEDLEKDYIKILNALYPNRKNHSEQKKYLTLFNDFIIKLSSEFFILGEDSVSQPSLSPYVFYENLKNTYKNLNTKDKLNFILQYLVHEFNKNQRTTKEKHSLKNVLTSFESLAKEINDKERGHYELWNSLLNNCHAGITELPPHKVVRLIQDSNSEQQKTLLFTKLGPVVRSRVNRIFSDRYASWDVAYKGGLNQASINTINQELIEINADLVFILECLNERLLLTELQTDHLASSNILYEISIIKISLTLSKNKTTKLQRNLSKGDLQVTCTNSLNDNRTRRFVEIEEIHNHWILSNLAYRQSVFSKIKTGDSQNRLNAYNENSIAKILGRIIFAYSDVFSNEPVNKESSLLFLLNGIKYFKDIFLFYNNTAKLATIELNFTEVKTLDDFQNIFIQDPAVLESSLVNLLNSKCLIEEYKYKLLFELFRFDVYSLSDKFPSERNSARKSISFSYEKYLQGTRASEEGLYTFHGFIRKVFKQLNILGDNKCVKSYLQKRHQFIFGLNSKSNALENLLNNFKA